MDDTTLSNSILDGMQTAQSKSWDAAAAASANSGVNPEAARYFASIREADAYIAGSLFAHVAEFAAPFTKQFRITIRYRVPQLKEVYDEADKLQSMCRWRYSGLRIFTGFLFAAFLWYSIAAYSNDGPYAYRVLEFAKLGRLGPATFALALGFSLFLVRKAVRWFFLDHHIDKPVGKLAHYMSTKFNSVVFDTNMACGQIESRTDFGTGLGWAQRAWGWSKIALWNSIKTRALDGYTTVVFWRIQVFDTHTERVWRLIKGLFLLAALFALFSTQGSGAQRAWIISWPPICAAISVWLVAWYVLFFLCWKNWMHRKWLKWLAGFLILLVPYVALAELWVRNGENGVINWTIPLTGAIFVTWFWFGWIVWDERDDDLWTKNFRNELKIDGVTAMNTSFYFNSISARFQNLVEQLIDAQRSSRGTPPPPTNNGE